LLRIAQLVNPCSDNNYYNNSSTRAALLQCNFDTNMKLYLFTSFLVSILVISGTTLGLPVNGSHHLAKRSSNDVVEKRQLQVLVDVSVILNAAAQVIKGIEAVIDLINGDTEEAKGELTQDLVSKL
jgi:hypothetical protein